MRKYIIGLCAFLLSLMLAAPAFAQEDGQIIFVGADGSVLLDGAQSSTGIAKPVGNTRGSMISTGTLRISNPGKGQIGVYMQTLTHMPVDEIGMYIYVDRWIESDQRWAQVENYTFNYTKADNGGSGLTRKSVSFNIVGQPKNCYYRLRGRHSVVLGGAAEMLKSQTDGILIAN